MATAIIMPQVGQDIEKARILEWFVEVGQEVSEGDVLATVESDKANFEVEAFGSGTILALLFEVGDEAEVFKPIAYMGARGEELQDEPQLSGEEQISPDSSHTSPREPVPAPIRTGKLKASPSARRIASAAGLRLEGVSGSGPDGRIIREDVETCLSRSTQSSRITPLARKIADDIGLPHQEVAGSGVRGKVVRNDIMNLLGPPRSVTLQPEPGDRVLQFGKTRKIIAERLSYSKQTIPHYYLFMDVNMSPALTWRQGVNQSGKGKISLNDMLIQATAGALNEHPELNAHVDEEKVLIKAQINLGVAVASQEGLLVPVIAGADKLSLEEISTRSRKNAEAARRGVSNSTEKGTFTISNLGMLGITKFLPIINPPECAILSAGNIEKKAVPDGAGVKFIDNMTLGIACDHRAVDGEKAALFLGSVKRNLEKYSTESKE